MVKWNWEIDRDRQRVRVTGKEKKMEGNFVPDICRREVTFSWAVACRFLICIIALSKLAENFFIEVLWIQQFNALLFRRLLVSGTYFLIFKHKINKDHMFLNKNSFDFFKVSLIMRKNFKKNCQPWYFRISLFAWI